MALKNCSLNCCVLIVLTPTVPPWIVNKIIEISSSFQMGAVCLFSSAIDIAIFIPCVLPYAIVVLIELLKNQYNY